MLIKAKTKIGLDTAYQLTVGQDLFVGKSVVLQAGPPAVTAEGDDSFAITVEGRIVSASEGISVNATGENLIKIAESGSIVAAGFGTQGLRLQGGDFNVQNAGTIYALGAIRLFDVEGQTAEISNSGMIRGQSSAIESSAIGSFKLVNTGLIEGLVAVESGAVTILNRGEMLGEVQLGEGRGLFDNSQGGALYGMAYGGAGNDRFKPGASVDQFYGGEGVDTLDFSGSKAAVWVDLDAPENNRGRAKGDSYAEYEILIGSAAGGDRLVGYLSGPADLRGLGGADTILGGNASDRITGGAAKDLLTGGSGDDLFIFGTVADGGDRITDFQSSGLAEFLVFGQAGFGFSAGGIVALVTPGAFHAGTTNRAADAGDRFIWETDATKLWFDRDGTGSRFAPVLIADLHAGATLTAEDILIL